MYLCLDVGNTQIHGGVFSEINLIFDFRLNTKQGWSSDQLGVMLKSLMREKNIAGSKIQGIGIASVVPSVDYHLKNACLKYFQLEPTFITYESNKVLQAPNFKNPQEIGADLVAAGICATTEFSNTNLVIVDMGTATTVTAINNKKEFLGGLIMPGLSTQIQSLAASTEKLFLTNIEKPSHYVGKTTKYSIQAGLYFGHLGALKHCIEGIALEMFHKKAYKVIGTGGFCRLFQHEKIFDYTIFDLVLKGTLLYLLNNA